MKNLHCHLSLLLLATALCIPLASAQISSFDDVYWDNSHSNTFRGVDGEVRAIAVDPVGNVYVGGTFEYVGDAIPAKNIAMWDGASWNTLDGGLSGSVNALVYRDGVLYVGGSFSNAGGNSNADRIATRSGGQWNAIGSGTTSSVEAIAFDPDGVLYVADGTNVKYFNGNDWVNPPCGNFGGTNLNSLAIDSVGRIYAGDDQSKGVKRCDNSWVFLDGTTQVPKVWALAVDQHDRLYVGGGFTNASGDQDADYIIVWTPDPGAWSPLGTGTSGRVDHIVTRARPDNGTDVFLGGLFNFNGSRSVEVNHVAKWDGDAYSPMGGGVYEQPSALALDADGNAYVGGAAVTRVGDISVDHLARWDATTDTWSGYGTGMAGLVRSIVTDSRGNVYIGGDFTSVGEVSANRVAMWNAGDQPENPEWLALGSGIEGNKVNALTLDTDDNLYAAGLFHTAGGVEVGSFAKWDGQAWSNPSGGTGFNSVVNSLVVDPVTNDLYASGNYTSVDGNNQAGYFARLRNNAWEEVNGGLSFYGLSMAIGPDGNLYVGGGFQKANNVSGFNRIAMLDLSDDSWHKLGDGFTDIVDAIAFSPNGNLFAGGRFGNYRKLAVWNMGDSATPSWSEVGGGTNSNVYALTVDEAGGLYVGGQFTKVGDNDDTARYVAKWDGNEWTTLGTGLENRVQSMGFDPLGNLFIGGTFTEAGTKVAPHFVAWTQFAASALGVEGNGVKILNHDPAPSEADGTDFGEHPAGAPVAVPFEILSLGGQPLQVNTITLSGDTEDFTVGDVSACTSSPINAGERCQFEITFDRALSGVSSATVAISSDDLYEPDFDFAIAATAVDPLDFGDAPDETANTDENNYNTRADDDGPAHVVTDDVFLGSLIDQELDAAASEHADGDDDNAETNDEDGVQLPSALFYRTSGSGEVSASLSVTVYGAGNLYAWLDFNANGDFDDANERIVDGLALGSTGTSATTSITFPIPDGAVSGSGSVVTYARFRFCSVADECDGPTASAFEVLSEAVPASDGEVEDYEVTLTELTATPTIPAPGSGGTIGIEGGNLVVTSAFGAPVIVPVGSLTSLTLDGSEEDETVSIDWGVVQQISQIVLNLAGGFDALTITQGSGITSELTYVHTDATSGTITDLTGNTITFSGLDPIVDNMDVAHRVFTFSSSADTITLSADGDGEAGDGYSFIDSEFAEEVRFLNPTSSLTIVTGDGVNRVDLGLLDTPLDDDFADLFVTGGTAPDAFVVTPAPYEITITAGDPVGVCDPTTGLGDGLSLDFSLGAEIDAYTEAGGDGSYTFSTGEGALAFFGVESVGAADLSVSSNYETLYSTQNFSAENPLIITLSNAGPYDAHCVRADVSALVSTWLSGAVVTSSAGSSFSDPTWSIDTVPVGGFATLTLTGLVVAGSPDDISFTVNSTQDLHPDNDVAANEVALFGFPLPAQAQVNAALYFTKDVAGGSYEELIVGLYQGVPGIEGAVWCKIPTSGPSWPPPGLTAEAIGDAYRPCSEGLPFPLHVNDIFEDDGGDLWLATWGSEGLYRSGDGGETWNSAWPGLGPGTDGTHWSNVYAITEDASSGILYVSANSGQFYRSLNGGELWQEMASLPGMASDTPWSLVAGAPGTVYAGTFGNGVYVTNDFGFTWAPFDENDDLLNVDQTGDDFAGHVFDLEIIGANLYAGTGRGVWVSPLAGGGWTPLGPTVTRGASALTPEVRTLVSDGVGLAAGTWGFGAFTTATPTTPGSFEPVALRGHQVTVIAVSADGDIFVGSSSGETSLVTFETATGIDSGQDVALPAGYALGQNYPNPFNPVTTIEFALPASGRVQLLVYDLLGREVAELVNGALEAGHHEVAFDAQSLPTGTYLYRLSTAAGSMSRSLILMK